MTSIYYEQLTITIFYVVHFKKYPKRQNYFLIISPTCDSEPIECSIEKKHLTEFYYIDLHF
jgi:hypothetical protein